MTQENAQGWREFLSLCQSVSSVDQLEELFALFLTLEEKNDLATRTLLIKGLLKGGRTQREIARDLGISIAKITRGSNALKIINDQLKQFLASVLCK